MIRKCDGTDPNLIGFDKEPCNCGLEFDDARRMVIWPHIQVPTPEEKEALIKAWETIKASTLEAFGVIAEAFAETQEAIMRERTQEDYNLKNGPGDK